MNIDEEVKKHLHIVICGDNVNSLGVVRSLGEKGVKPIVILVQESHIPVVEHSKYVQQVIKTSSMEESVTVLKTFANKTYKPFVYTTDDNHQSLLDEHYESLKDNFYFFNGGESGRISYYNNKNVQCELAQRCGFSIPKFEVVEKGILPQTLSYPIFTKTLNPCMSGWKRDVFICHSEDELMKAYQNMISEKLILQEYISKQGEYSIQGISINGGKDVLMPFERMYLRYSDTSFGGWMYYQPFQDEDLKIKIKTMLQHIKYTGIFEIEFLVDKKSKLHFLEINLRFSASNYGVTIGGLNLPYVWACSMLLGKFDASKIIVRKDRYYVMNELKDREYIKRIGLFPWLKDFINADAYYLRNKKDPMPAISFWWHKLLKYVKK